MRVRKPWVFPTKKRSNMRPRECWLGLLSWVILSSGVMCDLQVEARSTESPKPDAAIEAVFDYVKSTCPYLTQPERAEILRARSVREVKDWPFQDRLQRHRLFVFPNGWTFNEGATIVAVGDDLLPFPIDDARDFNELLQKEGILVRAAEEARKAAELFLKCYRVKYVLDHGLELGVNVIQSPDDILFRDEIEKAALTKEIQIEPPKLIGSVGKWRFRFYSWEKEGSGLLEKHEIVISQRAIVEYTTTPLKGDVGMWSGVR